MLLGKGTWRDRERMCEESVQKCLCSISGRSERVVLDLIIGWLWQSQMSGSSCSRSQRMKTGICLAFGGPSLTEGEKKCLLCFKFIYLAFFFQVPREVHSLHRVPRPGTGGRQDNCLLADGCRDVCPHVYPLSSDSDRRQRSCSTQND